MKGFQIEAVMLPPRLKVDDSMTLHFSTKEMSNEDIMKALEFKNKAGWVLFSEQTMSNSDVPASDKKDGKKSASILLRNVMYRWWEQLGSKGNSEDFYQEQMAKITDQIKSKLN